MSGGLEESNNEAFRIFAEVSVCTLQSKSQISLARSSEVEEPGSRGVRELQE